MYAQLDPNMNNNSFSTADTGPASLCIYIKSNALLMTLLSSDVKTVEWNRAEKKELH